MAEAMLYQLPAPVVRTKPPNVSGIRQKQEPKRALSEDPHLARGQVAIQAVISQLEAWGGGDSRRGS